MGQLGHVREPILGPSSVARIRSRRCRSFPGLPAPPRSNSPSTAPRYHPTLATLAPSLPAPALATPRARAETASARPFPSTPPQPCPPQTATPHPTHCEI